MAPQIHSTTSSPWQQANKVCSSPEASEVRQLLPTLRAEAALMRSPDKRVLSLMLRLETAPGLQSYGSVSE